MCPSNIIPGRHIGRRRGIGPGRRFLLMGLLLTTLPVYGQSFDYADAPLRRVLDEVEDATAYHFLYRDALVTGKTVTFDADAPALLDALAEALRAQGIRMQVDAERRQVLLSDAEPAGSRAVVTGQVIDDASGVRLPFATLTWDQDGRLRGVAANDAGAFQFLLPLAGDPVDLTASYVGYRPQRVRLDPHQPLRDLTLRLVPEPLYGQEVVVSGAGFLGEVDTTWQHLLQPGFMAPLGEGNVLRALQTLPAVSLSPALSAGLNVRGSRADGFQVLLDGASVYNQQHLFGLFDAFNEEALHTVGLFYSIAPAQVPAPPGGTLTLVTRTGAQTAPRAKAGLSNTAYRTTAEGPLLGGRGSWLVSGRRSYLDAVDWLGSDGLVALGFDGARDVGLPTLPARTQVPRLPGDAEARFFDLHGKLYAETPHGHRLMASGYLGGDAARQDAVLLDVETTSDGPRLVRQPVTSTNEWGNGLGSLSYQRPVGDRAYTTALLATSHYRSAYARDDFIYTPEIARDAPRDAPPAPERFVEAFTHDNRLAEWKLTQHLDAVLHQGTWTAGYVLQHVAIDYEEHSAARPRDFVGTQRSTQLDLFTQLDLTRADRFDLGLGLRSYYFSEGDFFRWSPRLQVRWRPARTVSAGVGFSRNYQFLHRLSLPNDTSADVWILSTAAQPPASVDYGAASLALRLGSAVFVQAEAYAKQYENMRQHEVAVTRRKLHSSPVRPWLHDAEGRARGLELLLRHHLGPLRWTHGYTLAKMTIQHPEVNDGAPFRADWDRRHQLTSHLEGDLGRYLAWSVTGLYASGAPNALAFTDPGEPAELPAYQRIDAGLRVRHTFGSVTTEAQVSVFNLLDRRNVWYRAPVPVLDGGVNPPRLRFVNADVYDLGFQPAFEVSLTF